MRWIRQIIEQRSGGWPITVLLCVAVVSATACWQWPTGGNHWPTSHFSGRTAPVSSGRCTECHPGQAASLAQAPHTLTLHRASSPEIVARFHGMSFSDTTSGDITDTFEFRNDRLWRRCSTYPDSIPIDWVFGSGRHAQTPVTVRDTPEGTTELLEHRLSHYPGIGIDLTLGNATATQPGPGWHGLGTRMTAADAADCFGCHTTWLPKHDGPRGRDERLDLERLVAGVQCARCHLEGESHLSAVNSGKNDIRMERWPDLSPLDSIRRCGECHRRDDQLTREELRPDNLLLVRFAPVGLSQSRCFTAQPETGSRNRDMQRLDCLTCHDPHRAAETDATFYTQRCASCHGTEAGQANICTSKSASERCLDCHMPKVEVQPHLKFTDHWIRKRP